MLCRIKITASMPVLNDFAYLTRSVDFREFVMALQFLQNPSLDDVIDLTFRCIDLNNDGTITKGMTIRCDLF
jgi:Ca2+-binding EF-hand superfamily protein